MTGRPNRRYRVRTVWVLELLQKAKKVAAETKDVALNDDCDSLLSLMVSLDIKNELVTINAYHRDQAERIENKLSSMDVQLDYWSK